MTTSDLATPRDHADLVLRGGIVLALDPAGTRAEAVAVRNGRIVAVGSVAEVSEWIGDTTRVMELAGRAVIPGINDSHLHACWLGARWPHTFFGASADTSASADAPASAEAPEGEGQLAPGPLVTNRDERRAAILRAGRLLTEMGITSYTEPGLGPGEDDGETGCFHNEVLDVYRELAAEGDLLQRVTALALYGVLDGPSDLATVVAGIEGLAHARERAEKDPDPAWLNIPGVKIFGDLIPLSRQAWTNRTYNDGTHGDLLVEGASLEQKAADLAAMIRAAHAAGLQLGVHATGDRTIQLVIDAISEAAAQPGAQPTAALSHTIIHGDLATAEQIDELARLGIWLNAQSGIAAHTHDWLAAVMDDAGAAEAWRYGDALAAGVLVLSSDAPVLGFDWRRGIADAEARIVRAGASTDSAARESRLLGLLRAYTAVPAEQDRAAEWKGTIEVGKVADLAILAANPFDVGAPGLPGVDIDATVLDGRVVFERSQ